MSYNYGVRLPNGSTLTHGEGANIKHPFNDLPVVMHELDKGTISFSGPFGFIEFTTEHRLPRHVHMEKPNFETRDELQSTRKHVPRFLHERIVVLEGVALVQMNDDIFVIPPRTLVTIAPGVPHTWTACAPGVSVGSKDSGRDFITSNGRFLMLYEYEESTAFFPTRQTHTLKSVQDYEACDEGELESIRIPALTADEVSERCWFIWNRDLRKPAKAGMTWVDDTCSEQRFEDDRMKEPCIISLIPR